MMCQGAIVATMDWLYPLSGFVVGAIVGLTGMGGGSLMTPLLILLFGVHPLTAVGTDARGYRSALAFMTIRRFDASSSSSSVSVGRRKAESALCTFRPFAVLQHHGND